MGFRRSLALVCGVVLAASVSPSASLGDEERAVVREVAVPASGLHPNDVFFFRTQSDALVAFAPSEGGVRLRAEGAIAGRQWSQLFAATPLRSTTRMSIVDTLSGRSGEQRRLRGRFAANIVSGSGDFVALTQPRGPDATPWMPDGRRRTKLLVADATSLEVTARFNLKGNFEPEAFSTDDRRMFLIKYMPATAPSHYSVRRLNLESGDVAPIRRLKLSAPGIMRGTGRMQVLAPDGEQLYTLYTQQGPNYAHEDEQEHDRGTIHAFVHVLNLRRAWAHCIDLPMPFGMGHATASAITVSPDGSKVYVSDWSNGAVAVIDPERLVVRRVVEARLGRGDDSTFAAASRDHLYLAGNSTVAMLDSASLEVVNRWRFRHEVTGLRVSPEGRTVYVGMRSRLVSLDPATGTRSSSLPVPGGMDLVHATRVG